MEPTEQTAAVDPGQLLTEATPQTAQPAPLTEPAQVEPPPQPQAPPPADEPKPIQPPLDAPRRYAVLDWGKTNRQLAKEVGVSHQAIAYWRRKLFPDGVNRRTTRPPGEQADFGDILGTEDLDAQAAIEKEAEEQEAQPAPSVATAQTLVNYRKTSEMIFDMATGTMVNVFGPEWAPRQMSTPTGQVIDERESVVSAIETYVRTKNIPDIPPGWMLCFIVAIYSAPRMQQPTTKGKLKLGLQWFKNKFSRKKKLP